MKLQTALENLSFFAYHGLYPEEKTNGGNFSVDVWIDQEVPEGHNMQDLKGLVNYEEIFQIIKSEMEIRRDLIEDLAKTMLDRINQHLVDKDVLVTLKITKPNPGGRFGSGAASVTLQA